jgi:hypothetical protein
VTSARENRGINVSDLRHSGVGICALTFDLTGVSRRSIPARDGLRQGRL